jgi:metal-responsive CopG/Arc/MetJ family transcriptional regulator
MQRITMTVTEQIVRRLDGHSQSSGLTKSDIVRRALEFYLDHLEKDKKDDYRK